MQAFPKQLLKSVVQRIYDWAGSTLAMLDRSFEPATVEIEDESQRNLPPAHWLERVRQAAPELLQTGEPMRVRPSSAFTQPTGTGDRPSIPTPPLHSEKERVAEAHQTIPAQSHTLVESALRLRPVFPNSVNDRVSFYTSLPQRASSDPVIERSQDQRAELLAADLIQDSADWGSFNVFPDAPIRLKPLPLKFTAFSSQTTATPPVSFRRDERSPEHSNNLSLSTSSSKWENCRQSQLRRLAEFTTSSQEPASEIERDSVGSAFTEPPSSPQRELRSPSFEDLRSPFRTLDLEGQNNPFPQSIRTSDYSIPANQSTSQFQQINSSSQDIEDLFLEPPTQRSQWIDLPDFYDRSGHEDKNWAFILGDDDHLQRLLKEQQGDDRA